MNQNPGIFGRKIGCTQLFAEDGNVERVTVIETGAVTVLGHRTLEKDGYTALILGLDERKEKHTTSPVKGQYESKREGSKGLFIEAKTTPKRTVKELRCKPDFAAKYTPGQVMKLDEIFTVGQTLDAQGVTRGRGFTGVMRRWNFSGFNGSHGTHEYFRHGGSIGTNMTPGRTLPGLKMPGQYGNETVSILNLVIARVDAEQNLVMVKGGVPGSKNSLVMIRQAVKARVKGTGPVSKKAKK
jgi:large subunit ribosomal protein L3